MAISTRIMYDDYDLDYTYAPAYEYDLDETYDAWVQSYAHTQLDEDLDEEYTRDTQDYDALAYKHYAWYNTHTLTLHTPCMPLSELSESHLT